MKKVFLFISFLAIIGCGNSTPDESDAKDVARSVILQNLKNPIDANFHHNEIIKTLGDSTFEYTETINATNSYGGSIKQDAFVKIKFLQDDPSEITNWTILDIQFTER